LLKNLEFTVDMESELMGNILDDKMKPDAAAKAWLKKESTGARYLARWRDHH
jgi:glycine betaine/proline transport system substrate-binding protein